MVDDVNPDAAFLKSLPDGRNLRRLFISIPPPGRTQTGTSLLCTRSTESAGERTMAKSGIFHKKKSFVYLLNVLLP